MGVKGRKKKKRRIKEPSLFFPYITRTLKARWQQLNIQNYTYFTKKEKRNIIFYHQIINIQYYFKVVRISTNVLLLVTLDQ
jgi:hypothetical protein